MSMDINRRHWLQGTLPLLMGSMGAHAQTGQERRPAGNKVPRIFMILYRGETPVEKGFADYFQSRKLTVELIVRNVDRDLSKIPDLLAQARRMQVDLIYVWGTPVAVAVAGKLGSTDPKKHITDIPIVFTMVSSPEGAGLITHRASSGRNITGVSHVVPIEQQISAIKAYRPFQRMAVLYNPGEPNAVQSVDQLRQSAQRSGFVLIEQAIPLDDKQNPIETALAELVQKIAQQRPQVLYLGADSFIAAKRKEVTEAALAQKLPVFSATEVLLRDGKALFGLVSDYVNVGRLTAFKAEQILMRGARAQDVPIETLAQFSYIVNMSVAEQLDYYPSLKVINFAEVIR